MANRFWIGQSGGGTYASTDWSLTTGGAGGQLSPTASDDVKFDGAGTFGNTNCTVGATANALTLIFSSGYTATITISATFTIVVAGSFTDNTAHTWTNNSVAAGTLTISATSTITSGGKTFPGNVSFTTTSTKTLVGDWTITGLLTVSGTTTLNKTTAEVMTCGLGVSMNAAMSGTGNLTLTGGNYTGTAGLSITGIFNFAGNVTINSSVAYSGGTIKYTSGTVSTAGSTLSAVASTTWDTNGISWAIVTLSGISQTHTINSLLTATTLNINGVTTTVFAGTAGFTTGTLASNVTTAHAVTLVNSVTYTITTALTVSGTRTGSSMSFTSNDGTLKATMTLQQGASCNVLANFTRIDASNGRAIYTFNGTVTTCNNIYSFTDALPPAIGRVIHAGATY